MFQIIYRSKDNISFSEKELKRLLIRSRFRNGADGITGVLLLHEGMFFQALEGDEAAVKATFARIGLDSRHSEVCILGSGARSGEHRNFGKWAMGFVNAGDRTQLLSGFVEIPDVPDFSKLNVLAAMELLRWASERTSRMPAEALD